VGGSLFGGASAAGSGLFGGAPAVPAATPAPSLFGGPAAAVVTPAAGAASFSFAAPAVTAVPAAGGLFGAPIAATPSASGIFGGASTPAAPGPFGGAPAPTSTPAPAAGGLFGLAAAPTPGFITAITAATPATVADVAASGAQPSGLPSRHTSSTLGQIIGSARLSLAEQTAAFSQEASTVESWDALICSNRAAIVTLHDDVLRVREAHEEVEAELELVLQHQDALHAHLLKVEAALDDELAHDSNPLDRSATERQEAYRLAEEVDSELAESARLLAAAIATLNRRPSVAASAHTDPSAVGGVAGGELGALVEVLDAHLSALQWVEARSQGVQLEAQQLRAASRRLVAGNGYADGFRSSVS